MTASPSPLSKLPLLLLMLLLTPAAGLASTQAPPPDEEASAPAQEQQEEEEAEEAVEPKQFERPVRLLDESELPRERADRGTRIAAEMGLGLLTGLAGGVAGTFLVGTLACNSSFGACVIGSVLGGGIGLGFGSAAGVWWAGGLSGADGKYGSALIGSMLGLAVTFGMLPLGAVGYVGLLAPVLGGVIGYGLSMSPETEALAVAVGGTRLRPLLSLSRQGSFVGLGGHF
jgi:hypothetical protein